MTGETFLCPNIEKVVSTTLPGKDGLARMKEIMSGLRENAPADIAGRKIESVTDYEKPEETGLPKANVLSYVLEDGAKVMIRPSGTEPKIKAYYTTLGKAVSARTSRANTGSSTIPPD